MDPQTVSSNVRALYEQYPFPAPVSSAHAPAIQGWCNYTFLRYQALNDYRPSEQARILDAGCGTGETLWPLRINNPGAHITGYDLSEASLQAAKDKLATLGATHVQLAQRDLNDLPPEDPFDLIFCTGVLHHMADPLRGLRNVTAQLKPDGLLVLMLYASHPRAVIKKVQQVLALLGTHRDPLETKVDVARRLLSSLPQDHPFHAQLGMTADYLAKDEHLLDTFYHPREVTYTLPELFDLLDAADLELAQFFNEPAFRLDLDDPTLERRAMFMSRRQKYILADLLNPTGDYHLIVRRKTHRPAMRPKLPHCVPVVSPVVSRIDRTPLVPNPFVPPQALLEVSGFSTERYRLDDQTAAVLALCDGIRSAEDIGHPDLLAALEQRHVILYKPL